MGLFVAEGAKIIQDFLASGLILHSLFSSEDTEGAILVSPQELQKITALNTANTALAVFHIPKMKQKEDGGLVLVLDAVRDPGNLGTIIRLCDWFGVQQLICSEDTVDCYNPKVVQATMGSLARVHLVYTDISSYLKQTTLPVYAALMDGDNVYDKALPEEAILVMGNEANGISSEHIDMIQNKLTIPSFSSQKTAESLNVATATGILLSEFRRTIEK